MRLISKNKRAYFDYEFDDTLEAGIVLQGHEVKSIKFGNVNIRDAVVSVTSDEVRLLNMDIPLYKKTAPQTVPGYEAKGARRLLLTKQQRARMRERTQKTGLRIVALEVLETKTGRIKIKIGLGKLKKKVQKKSLIQERDSKREMDRQIKSFIS